MIPKLEIVLNSIKKSAKNSILEGNFVDAEYMLNSILKLIDNSKYSGYAKGIYRDLGVVNWNLGRIADSRKCFLMGLECASLSPKQNEDKLFLVNALKIVDYYQQAKSARSRQLLDESSRLFIRAIDLSDLIGCPDFKIKCIRQLSGNYWKNNRIKEFFFLNLLGYHIAMAIHHYKEAGICCNNMGVYYWKTSRYSEAVEVIKRGLSLSEIAKAEDNIYICMSNLGVLSFEIGDFRSARINLNKVIAFDRRTHDNSGLAKDLNNLGLVLRGSYYSDPNSDNLDQSISALLEAIPISSAVDKPNIYNNLGRTFMAAKNTMLAYNCFITSLRLTKGTSSDEDYLSVMNSLGFCYLEMGQYERAKSIFRKVTNQADMENHKLLWETYFGLGEFFVKSGRLHEAVASYEKSIECIESIRSDLSMDVQKISFIKDKTIVYKNIVKIYFLLYEAERSDEYKGKIFKYVEKAKARSLFESIAKIRNSTLDDGDRESNRILMDVINEKFSIRRAIQLTNILIDIFWNTVEQKRTRNLVEIQSIRSIMAFAENNNIAIVEYFLMDEYSIAMFIHENLTEIIRLPPAHEIDRMISGFNRFLNTPGISKTVGIPAAKRIFNIILKPVIGTNQPKNLVIIPDRCLCYLPFEALIDNNLEQSVDEYLINKGNISYMPSASLAFVINERQKIDNNKRFGLIAFGNPTLRDTSYAIQQNNENSKNENIRAVNTNLINSQEEVKIAASIFARNDRAVYVKNNANEENLRLISQIPIKILHLACHGLVDYDDSSNSCLVLSNNTPHNYDGLLKVGELYEMVWNVQLVVLSACSSAIGEISEYEGVLSLNRAFMYAGAESVISSIWEIEDKASRAFMKKFYYNLALSKNVEISLRLTKLDMINSEYNHPRYWAPFILYGGISKQILF